MKQWIQEIQQFQNELVEIRRSLHQMPEKGFDLKKTLPYVKEKLIEFGCEPVECGKSGLVVLLGKKPGKTFLLRADMDGLAIEEEADVEYASKNGHMHACGHDLHTTMLLGAAKFLKAHEDEIQGTVKLMFQSAEEIFEGSKDMIDAGVLKNPDVDAAMMIHVVPQMKMPAGCVLVPKGGIGTSAADLFQITIRGKGCHGSMPFNGIDPLIPMAHLLLGLQEIQTRELSVADKAVLTIGSVHAGDAFNVIPETAVLGGSLRTYDEKVRAHMKQRIVEIAEATGAVYRCSVEVKYTSGCPVLMNDADLCQDIYVCLSEHLGQSVIQMPETSPSGSEDFAYVSQEVPGAMLMLAAGNPEEGYEYPLHHPKAMFDESVLAQGASVLCIGAMQWLEKNKE